MKRIMLALVMTTLLAVSAWAAALNDPTLADIYRLNIGVRLNAEQGQTTLAVGQTIRGVATDPTLLSRKGLAGVKAGDEMSLTHIKDGRCKLMHVPSGKSVDLRIPPSK